MSAVSADRFALLRWAALGLAMAGCSSKTIPVGGLMIVIGTDGTLDPHSIRVAVRSGHGDEASHVYLERSFQVSSLPAPGLPATLAVASNGDPSAMVTIDASAWPCDPSATDCVLALDARHYEVSRIPTSWVAELDVIFSASCSKLADPNGTSTCPPGKSCDGARTCPLAAIAATGLSEFHGQVDRFAKIADGSTDTSQPFLADGGTPDREEDRFSDAALADADTEDVLDGLAVGDATVTEAGECAPGSERCKGSRPQACDFDGKWKDAESCVLGVTQCRGVRCVPVPPSCQGAPTGAGIDCSFAGTADCCESDPVPGGTFLQNYDGAVFPNPNYPATLSSFGLDAFEVTVGRFRQFVQAAAQGWRPSVGQGVHVHLNQGNGLRDTVDGGITFEKGWDTSWQSNLPMTFEEWDSRLACDATATPTATWTPKVGSNEKLPITCVDWFQAYAFCIWDNAFLPSTAEWNYAATGGNEQRAFAWGKDAPHDDSQRAIWGCNYGSVLRCGGLENVAPVGSAFDGNARWGQWDLTGSVWEWVLDFEALPNSSCVDCASIGSGPGRVMRGGSFYNSVSDQYVSGHLFSKPDLPHPNVGFRCARSP